MSDPNGQEGFLSAQLSRREVLVTTGLAAAGLVGFAGSKLVPQWLGSHETADSCCSDDIASRNARCARVE